MTSSRKIGINQLKTVIALAITATAGLAPATFASVDLNKGRPTAAKAQNNVELSGAIIIGRVDNVQSDENTITVLGTSIDVHSLESPILPAQYVAVFGSMNSKGDIEVDRLVVLDEVYSPGSSIVVYSGLMPGPVGKNGTLQIGNVTVTNNGALDISPWILANQSSLFVVVGTQAIDGAPIEPHQIAAFSKAGYFNLDHQGLVGIVDSRIVASSPGITTGTTRLRPAEVLGIDGSGAKTLGIDGSGAKIEGIDGSGAKIEGIDGSGAKTFGIDGSGAKTFGIDGSGAKTFGIDGSGAKTFGIDGSGAKTFGIDGSGAKTFGIDGSGAKTFGIDGSGAKTFGIDGSGAKTFGIDGSGAKTFGIDGSGAKTFGIDGSGAKTFGIDGSGAKTFGIDGSGAKTFGIDGSGAKTFGIDGSGAKTFGIDGSGAKTFGIDGSGTDTEVVEPPDEI
ncbi:pentapeptide repeat-containing protein [Wenzhouxiangella sp. XN24]|uniref:pentapeptide repeat-containing protein n=1 Tax=Wenzhouxiangella sp. XN24 TaxID=2713569 RepID=UPI0013EB54C6|nr:pentapeptide repeat-containing protein [Wenzhouxiangella sp. XN24]NGX16433.1 pentapeptide repeat-containing protein [Wenzhouxiangella sp. XN24]